MTPVSGSKRIILLCLIGLAAGNAQALSFGGSFGEVTLREDSTGNIQQLYPSSISTVDAPKFSYSVLLQHEINSYLLGEIGLTELSHYTKNISFNKFGDPVSFNMTTKESISVIQASAGTSLFVTGIFAFYAKLGPTIHQNTYKVSLRRYENGKQVDQREDSKTTNFYKLGFYYGVGIIYEINDKLTMRVDYEDFGKLGKGATVDTFDIPGTTDNPESGGISATRVVFALLYRLI